MTMTYLPKVLPGPPPPLAFPLPLLLLLLLLLRSAADASTVLDVTSFGAVGDGVTDDTLPVALALRAAAIASSSPPPTVLFPRGGTFLTGPFNVSGAAGRVTIRVDGTILAISGGNVPNGEEYVRTRWPLLPPLPSYGTSEDGPYLEHQPFVYAKDVAGVRIIGSGTIDGQGDWWWSNARNRSLIPGGRPNLIRLVNCTDVEISGVTLLDSPFWSVHPVYCANVHVHHVTVRSRMYALNSDGIDPDSSRNVMIEHCDVSVGDDHIAIKAGRCGGGGGGDGSSPNDCRDPPFLDGVAYRTQNVTVRNNVFRVGMGVAVGSDTSGGVRDVYVYDNVVGLCDDGHCSGTCCGWGIGLHVKTTPTRGGVVENVTFRNNTVYNTTGFIRLEMNYQVRDDVIPADYPPTAVRNISFVGNRAAGGAVGAAWVCSSGDACEGIAVVGNSILNAGGSDPWSCRYVRTFRVAGNYPPGLEGCMRDSMNVTAPETDPETAPETARGRELDEGRRG